MCPTLLKQPRQEVSLTAETGLLNISTPTKCDQIHNYHRYDLVTPKARAKHELLFNKLASEVGLLNV
jgi:hypothetical protein